MNKTLMWVAIGVGVAFGVSFLLGAMLGAIGGQPGLETVILGLFAGAFTAYIGGNLAGNRNVDLASDEARRAALSLTPPTGQALLMVYRDGFVGKAAGLNLSLDGRPLAQLKSPRFTAVAVTPGDHQLIAAFGGLAGPQNNAGDLRFNAAAGETLIYKASVSMGAIKNTVKLERQPDAAAVVAKLQRMPMVASEV